MYESEPDQRIEPEKNPQRAQISAEEHHELKSEIVGGGTPVKARMSDVISSNYGTQERDQPRDSVQVLDATINPSAEAKQQFDFSEDANALHNRSSDKLRET